MNPANFELIRAIRGPVMLITLGVLLLLIRQTSATFGQLWPVLIIVFGVMKLLERLAMPAGTVPPGPPPGSYTPAPPPPQPPVVPPQQTGGPSL